ncbi:probable WRKY transcription factor 14 [Mercurialis annua]|uniref:probable WRKY transcription factor 14 n=1 Tax=Mercurialis annua TaxID=3986 RepID=UPI00215F1923|nr:probable WRKY transcription factor 14 [Mercurialis annua]
MENYQGDLTDILRATGQSAHRDHGILVPGPEAPAPSVSNCWEFASSSSSSSASVSTLDDINIGIIKKNSHGGFGDPFVNMRDPLLHELDNVMAAASGCSAYFRSVDDANNFSGANTSSSTNLLAHHHTVFEEDQMNNNNNNNITTNIFSRIQISPNNSTAVKLPPPPVSPPCESPVMASPRGYMNKGSSPMISIDMMNSKSCLIDNTATVQISSPRNLGIKRRKSQAKKVVCIPAPAAVNSRPSGEVVPSDLWAWRKYGQKPIKGSPYPRGYYRCSSSKGCSARKQVERSRTDPNMLVITYTSEHNHPWPTQRNALAGSTRAQPPKNITAATGSKSIWPSSHPQKTPLKTTKDELSQPENDTLSPTNMLASVKEEMEEENEKQIMEMGDRTDAFGDNYRPAMADCSHQHHQPEDFFSELDEIEADPLHHLLFDWSDNTNTTNNNNKNSYEEAKRGL